ncbi:MAG: hypothetical protein ACK5MV_00140 [Aminipila sp.]
MEMQLRTVRGQSARVVENKNQRFVIELYANGNWGNCAEGYNNEFETESQAVDFFKAKKNQIHS